MIRKRIIVIPLINYLYSPQKKPGAQHPAFSISLYHFFNMTIFTSDNIISCLSNPDSVLHRHVYTCHKLQGYVSRS